MTLKRWMEKVGAMTSADLERLRREYDLYRKALVADTPARLGPMSKTTKQLSACTGVMSFAQTALDAMKEGREGITVADFEAAHPNSGLASPIAQHLQRWEKLAKRTAPPHMGFPP